MRTGRRTTIVAVLVLLAAACVSPEEAEDSSSTSAAPDTTGATGGPTTTPWVADVEPTCFFLENYVWLAEGAQEQVVAALAEADTTAYPGILQPEEIPEATPGETIGAAPPLDQVIDIITIESGGLDPLSAAALARDMEIAASPVYLVGMANHWQFKPGTDAKPSDEKFLVESLSPNTGEEYIAVVDTGVIETEAFPWMFDGQAGSSADDSIVFNTSGDDYQLGSSSALQPSHGTFISSLIRQLAPDHRVSFAAVDEVVAGATTGRAGDTRAAGPGTTPSNEIDVLTGIEEIINRHTSNQVKALNLSWGTYPCSLDGDFSPALALEEAIGAWYDAFPNSHVFAAAGNEGPHLGPFYPAAFGDVTGVGALSPDGDEVFWDDGTPIYGNTDRTWVDAWAPGCAIVGLSGLGDGNEIVFWGGSSFAAPIAAAAWAQSDDPNRDPTNPVLPDELPTDPQGTC